MTDLGEKIREKVAQLPTVTSEGAGAARVNNWVSQASAVLLAVLELHRQVTDCFDEVCENCNGWSGAVAYWPRPTVRAIADKLGIEADHA